MAIAFVNSVSAAPGSAGGTTGSIDTTGANLIVVGVAWYSGGTPSGVTDSKSNTYVGLTSRSFGSAFHRLFYCLAPTVGSGHTFTVTGSNSRPSIIAYAFSGVAGGFQVESGAALFDVTSLATGSVTPAQNGALIFTGNGGEVATTDTVSTSGFSTPVTVSYSSGVNSQGSAAYYIQPTAAAINPTWAFSPQRNYVAVNTAVFLPVAPTLARVQSTGKVTSDNVNSIAVSFSTLPTVGNGLVVAVLGWKTSGTVITFPANGCVDNQGNVYELAVTQTYNLAGGCALYYCRKVTTSAGTFTVTITPIETTVDLTATVIEVSGVGLGLVPERISQTFANASTTPSTVAITGQTTVAEAFVVSVLQLAQGTAITSIAVGAVSPTWTEELEELGATHANGEVDSRIVTGIGALEPPCTWTINPSRNYTAILTTFRATSTPTGLIHVQSTPYVNTTPGTSVFIFPPTIGNAIVIGVSSVNGNPTGAIDNYGNTYEIVVQKIQSSSRVATILFCEKVTATGANFTITLQYTGGDFSVSAIEVGGITGGRLRVDQTISNGVASGTNPTTGTTAALRTTGDAFLVAVHFIGTTQASITVGAATPVWVQEFERLGGGFGGIGELDFRIVPSANGTTQSASWTAATANTWAAVLASFGSADTVPLITPYVTQNVVEVLTIPAADARVTQSVVEVLTVPTAEGRVTQTVVDLISHPIADGRVTQLLAETISYPPVAGRVTQIVVETITSSSLTASPTTVTAIWMGDSGGTIWVE